MESDEIKVKKIKNRIFKVTRSLLFPSIGRATQDFTTTTRVLPSLLCATSKTFLIFIIFVFRDYKNAPNMYYQYVIVIMILIQDFDPEKICDNSLCYFYNTQLES